MTKGHSARELHRCISCARTPLPVPLSPVRRIGASLVAARLAFSQQSLHNSNVRFDQRAKSSVGRGIRRFKSPRSSPRSGPSMPECGYFACSNPTTSMRMSLVRRNKSRYTVGRDRPERNVGRSRVTKILPTRDFRANWSSSPTASDDIEPHDFRVQGFGEDRVLDQAANLRPSKSGPRGIDQDRIELAVTFACSGRGFVEAVAVVSDCGP